MVDLIVKDEIHRFIKTDASASIGSDGLMGDKVLTINPGKTSSRPIRNNGLIASRNALEIEDLMRSVKTSVDNVQTITGELAAFTYKMNNGKGALSKLLTDEAFSESLKGTLVNLETSSHEFAKFTVKMNDGKGAFSRLVSDERLGNKIDSTISNLQSGTKGLSENMEAAKSNILLRGFFNNKKKAEAKRLAELKKKEELRMKTNLTDLKDSTRI
jgi:phospholipid/cholesterol/gamma-HCH transport system substrate-binding protein